MTEKLFRTKILDYYKKASRHDLPWRKTYDPYKILVSEIMLQQTQVSRVLKKYDEFLKAFPTLQSLSNAKTSDVLKIWQGLGYNRRALNLKQACEIIVTKFDGKFPKTADELESLPGIGQSTRGAIMAFAYNIPTVFIETNIRTVFIHFFFNNKNNVHDREILPLIENTLPKNPPKLPKLFLSDKNSRANFSKKSFSRDWYYALMDYGVYLKQTLPNPSRKSKHHTKQSTFKGSNREVRSKILKFVLKQNRTKQEIINHIGQTPHNVSKNISDLIQEGFIQQKNSYFSAK